MASIVNRYDTLFPRFFSKKSRVVMPIHQSSATTSVQGFYTLSMSPAPPSNAFTNGIQLIFDIEPHDLPEITQAHLRFKISASGSDVKLLPAYEFASQYTMEPDKGVGPEIHRWHGINCLLWDVLHSKEDQRPYFTSKSNYTLDDNKSEGKQKYWFNDTSVLEDGSSRYYYVPIPLNYWHMGAVDTRAIRAPIRLKIDLNSDILTDDSNGTIANVVLDSVELVVTSPTVHEFDEKRSLNARMKSDHAYTTLETERLTYSDKTMNANQEVSFALDAFVGKASALVVTIKGSTNPSGQGKIDYYEVGKNSTWDITNSSGHSLYSNGSPVDTEFLECINAQELSTKPIKGVYIIPFSEDIARAYQGTVNGYMNFSGSKDYLRLNLQGAGTAEVHRITLNALAGVGNYQLAYGNDVSDSLAFNASNTTIATAINALESVKNKGYTVTVTDDPSTATDVDITFSDRDGNVKDNIGLPRLIPQLAFDAYVSSVSQQTKGEVGWTSSSDREVSIYMLKYKEITFDTSGGIRQRDL